MARRRRFALVGGLAVSTRADPRFTRDVDLVVAVASDRDAEELVRDLGAAGYSVLAIVEHEAAERLSTVRLRAPSEGHDGVVVDLLFASSGIEGDIVDAAEPIEIAAGLALPVASIGHLVALKLLCRDDDRRPQDAIDLRALLALASPGDLETTRSAIRRIEQRGFGRGRDLAACLADAVRRWGRARVEVPAPSRDGTFAAPRRVIAIDWSGAQDGGAKNIYSAVAEGGRLVCLDTGRTRDQVVEWLISEARRDPNLVVGIDFAFSMPRWYLERRGLPDAPALWALAASEGEQWLRDCPWPFWARHGVKRWSDIPTGLRETDKTASAGGVGAKSVFQVYGAGAVGTGSIRGMPFLCQLRAAGFHIWPFDDAGFPLVVEIYPRLLTGAVTKGDKASRRALVADRFPDLDVRFAAACEASVDAFDAAVSALVMAQRVEAFRSLPAATDLEARLEGRIWRP